MYCGNFFDIQAYSASISGNTARLRWISTLYYLIINILGQFIWYLYRPIRFFIVLVQRETMALSVHSTKDSLN
jgi:hypothetical protein